MSSFRENTLNLKLSILPMSAATSAVRICIIDKRLALSVPRWPHATDIMADRIKASEATCICIFYSTWLYRGLALSLSCKKISTPKRRLLMSALNAMEQQTHVDFLTPRSILRDSSIPACSFIGRAWWWIHSDRGCYPEHVPQKLRISSDPSSSGKQASSFLKRKPQEKQGGGLYNLHACSRP